MAAVKEKTVVVTKYDLSSKDIILEIDDKKLKIVEVKKRKEYVKTVFGPKENKSDETISIPYKLQSESKIDGITAEDATATFEIGPKREGWITRDYQKMTVTARPIDSDSAEDQVQFTFEYPIKGGKLLTKTKQLK